MSARAVGGLLLALMLAASASGLLAADAPAPATPVAPLGEAAGAPADLAESLQATRQLLATLADLETHLAGVAQRALDQADAAPTLDERRRYEHLYHETSARLGELKATRADIQRQLERLESQSEATDGER